MSSVSWVPRTGEEFAGYRLISLIGHGRMSGTNPAGQQSNYVIVWTHEKRGSADHVDMLGTAREPGRSPTIYASWWVSAKDFMGKCRPQVSQQLCLETIEKVTGKR